MNNAKKYLSENRRLKDIYNSKIEQLRELKEMRDCIGSPMNGSEKVQSSNISNKTHELVCKIVSLEEDIKSYMEQIINKHEDITNKINGLDNYEHVYLLNLRYLNFMTWEEIACKMGYTFQWVHHLHKEALVNFSKKYELLDSN